MNMKKLLALLLAIVMLASLAACGSKDPVSSDPQPSGSQPVVSDPPAGSSEPVGSGEIPGNSDADGYTFSNGTLTLEMVVTNGNQGNPEGTWTLSENGSVVKEGTFETDTYFFMALTASDGSVCTGILLKNDATYQVLGISFNPEYVKFMREGQELFNYGSVEMVLETFVVDGVKYEAPEVDLEEVISGGSSGGEETSDGEIYTATVQVNTPDYTGDVTLTLTLDEDAGTFAINDRWGYVNVTGTAEISNFVVLTLTTEDGTWYRGCIQTDAEYNRTGIIFDENYDNGYQQTWTGLLDYGAVTFAIGDTAPGGGEQGGNEPIVDGEIYTAVVQVATPEYTGDVTLTLVLDEVAGTFSINDRWGYVNVTGTASINNFVVLELTTEDGTLYRGCIQTDASYNRTGIIFDENYDNGYQQTWTGLLDYGAVTFAIGSEVPSGGDEPAVVEGEVYTATVQVNTPDYTGDVTLTLTLDEDAGTFAINDRWGYVNVTGTASINNFVVLELTTEDGTLYRGCIQTDASYNRTGIIFDENYDNGYQQTWTGLLNYGAVTFTIAE